MNVSGHDSGNSATAGGPRWPPRLWRRRSLRARLTAASTVATAVGLVVAAVLLVWQVNRSLVAGLDDSLRLRVQDGAAAAAAGQFAVARSGQSDGSTLVQVVAANGRVLGSSPNIDGEGRLFTVPAPTSAPAVTQVSRVAAGEGAYRVAARRVSTPDGEVTVYAARPLAEISSTTHQLAIALAGGLPLLVALLAWAAWLLIGTALRPVEVIRGQVDAIAPDQLHARLDRPAGDDELAKLATTFNRLLDRVEAAAGQQRRFLADAAHELRSPVTVLSAQLEVYQTHPSVPVPAGELSQLADQARQLGLLVDSLLSLARLDANQPMRRQLVDLDDVVLAAVRLSRPAGPGGPGEATVPPVRPRLDTRTVSAVQVVGDPTALARVVRNLLDNATRYAATTVTVTVEAVGQQAVLTVADDGPGVAAADQERIFDRFTRLDDARSRDRGGAGLGLAIVREIVTAHRGTVTVSDNSPGARFVVTLPVATASEHLRHG